MFFRSTCDDGSVAEQSKKFRRGDDGDGLSCPICLSSCEADGEHFLVSLKCGHLFGDSCIRR